MARPAINILTAYDYPLFTQHFDPMVNGWDVVENGSADRHWDLVIVFERMRRPGIYSVRAGGTIFVAGEPPEVANYPRAFLGQFDYVYCAYAPMAIGPAVSREQHFNNWHFGYSAVNRTFRYDWTTIATMPIPIKTGNLSIVMSNVNYLPMHIKRLALIKSLQVIYSQRIDTFGRPHRAVEYKEDAILPYRFHLCVENCRIPGLWTEKIADALLSYAIPIYAGCPDIDRYFPGAVIPIDLDDVSAVRRTIDAVLADPETLYRQRLPALIAARKRLIESFDLATLIAKRLQASVPATAFKNIALKPAASFPFFAMQDVIMRIKRKAISQIWLWKVAPRG